MSKGCIPIGLARIGDQLEIALPEVTSDLLTLVIFLIAHRQYGDAYLSTREAADGNNHLGDVMANVVFE